MFTFTFHVYTNASGSFGCGGVVVPSSWFHLQWPDTWEAVDIIVKELVPIVIAAGIWGQLWHHSNICFHTDNMAVVAILRTRSGADI